MTNGSILVAQHNGAHVVKLVGDVRLTLCTALEDFFDDMFANSSFCGVVIDLTEADNVDSTTLGMMAKLALRTQRQLGLTPTIISTNPDITRLLTTMGFAKVFNIREEEVIDEQDLGELPEVACSEEAMREKVLDAHRVLMGLCPHNRAQFSELVRTLESAI